MVSKDRIATELLERVTPSAIYLIRTSSAKKWMPKQTAIESIDDWSQEHMISKTMYL